MTIRRAPVPPIIAQWIEELHNKQARNHVRDNYCAMLENVVDQVNSALEKFYKERMKKRENI